jgi:hypothetical protein
MKMMLPNVRGAFLQLFEAKTVNGEGEPAYSGAFLIDPVAQKALVDEINAKIDEVAAAKWGAKAAGVLTAMRKADKAALHDGDVKADYDGFPGMLYVSTRSKVRPLVIDRDRTPLTAADGRVYSGCFVNAQIELWAQDNSYGKRVNAQLKGVQFVKDGDAFGGGGTPANADDFGDLGVDNADDGGDFV